VSRFLPVSKIENLHEFLAACEKTLCVFEPMSWVVATTNRGHHHIFEDFHDLLKLRRMPD